MFRLVFFARLFACRSLEPSHHNKNYVRRKGAVFFQAGGVVLLSFGFFFFFHYYFVCFVSIQRRAVNIERESSWIACGIYTCASYYGVRGLNRTPISIDTEARRCGE